MGVLDKPTRILLPGDDEKATDSSDPTVVLEEGVRVITDTTHGDAHAPKRQLIAAIAAESEDWGDGFFVSPEPVLVQRAPDGSIIRTTALSEIPGVTYTGGQLRQDDPVDPLVVDEKPTPVPLATADREKLVGILSTRLFKYYKSRGPGDPRYNPFRDGLPDVPAGSPEHVQPLPGTELYPATDGQIHDWLRRFVADRAKVVNTRRFGGNTLQDLSLRIE